MDIVPALLVKTSSELSEQITRLARYYSHFQIDIADGQFVNNKTLSVDDLQGAFEKIKPDTLKNLTFDFDLMVLDYVSSCEKIDELAFLIKTTSVFPHAAAITNYKELVELYPVFSIGIAVDPDQSIDTINEMFDLPSIPIIQVMSVIPGKQGNPFIEDSLTKIEQLKMLDYRGKISIDGGVNNKTLPAIISRRDRPDMVCVGSYLSQGEDIESRVKTLQELSSGI